MKGDWIDAQDQEMDCGIKVDLPSGRVNCLPMTEVQVGDWIVAGKEGLRVLTRKTDEEKDTFEFMGSAVSSEKPKGVTVRAIGQAMRECRDAGLKILAVLGPAVVHTGGAEWICRMIRGGWLHLLFSGNALATHDIETALYGTSLGIEVATGRCAPHGHENHLRTINTIRRLGGIDQAVKAGLLKSGIMYECVKHQIPFILGGSIRDDGPLPEVITDVLEAQKAMRAHVPSLGFALMVASTLHSIATGNLLPEWVRVACADINPSTVTKMLDRGSHQTMGVVTDSEPFLRELAGELGC